MGDNTDGRGRSGPVPHTETSPPDPYLEQWIAVYGLRDAPPRLRDSGPSECWLVPRHPELAPRTRPPVPEGSGGDRPPQVPKVPRPRGSDMDRFLIAEAVQVSRLGGLCTSEAIAYVLGQPQETEAADKGPLLIVDEPRWLPVWRQDRWSAEEERGRKWSGRTSEAWKVLRVSIELANRILTRTTAGGATGPRAPEKGPTNASSNLPRLWRRLDGAVRWGFYNRTRDRDPQPRGRVPSCRVAMSKSEGEGVRAGVRARFEVSVQLDEALVTPLLMWRATALQDHEVELCACMLAITMIRGLIEAGRMYIRWRQARAGCPSYIRRGLLSTLEEDLFGMRIVDPLADWSEGGGGRREARRPGVPRTGVPLLLVGHDFVRTADRAGEPIPLPPREYGHEPLGEWRTWALPPKWFSSLLDERFWVHCVGQLGDLALRPPRLVWSKNERTAATGLRVAPWRAMWAVPAREAGLAGPLETERIRLSQTRSRWHPEALKRWRETPYAVVDRRAQLRDLRRCFRSRVAESETRARDVVRDWLALAESAAVVPAPDLFWLALGYLARAALPPRPAAAANTERNRRLDDLDSAWRWIAAYRDRATSTSDSAVVLAFHAAARAVRRWLETTSPDETRHRWADFWFDLPPYEETPTSGRRRGAEPASTPELELQAWPWLGQPGVKPEVSHQHGLTARRRMLAIHCFYTPAEVAELPLHALEERDDGLWVWDLHGVSEIDDLWEELVAPGPFGFTLRVSPWVLPGAIRYGRVTEWMNPETFLMTRQLVRIGRDVYSLPIHQRRLVEYVFSTDLADILSNRKGNCAAARLLAHPDLGPKLDALKRGRLRRLRCGVMKEAQGRGLDPGIVLTRRELAWYNREQNGEYVAIGDVVYDVTDFRHFYPAGGNALAAVAGQVITHRNFAYSLPDYTPALLARRLAHLRVGRLVPERFPRTSTDDDGGGDSDSSRRGQHSQRPHPVFWWRDMAYRFPATMATPAADRDFDDPAEGGRLPPDLEPIAADPGRWAVGKRAPWFRGADGSWRVLSPADLAQADGRKYPDHRRAAWILVDEGIYDVSNFLLGSIQADLRHRLQTRCGRSASHDRTLALWLRHDCAHLLIGILDSQAKDEPATQSKLSDDLVLPLVTELLDPAHGWHEIVADALENPGSTLSSRQGGGARQFGLTRTAVTPPGLFSDTATERSVDDPEPPTSKRPAPKNTATPTLGPSPKKRRVNPPRVKAGQGPAARRRPALPSQGGASFQETQLVAQRKTSGRGTRSGTTRSRPAPAPAPPLAPAPPPQPVPSLTVTPAPYIPSDGGLATGKRARPRPSGSTRSDAPAPRPVGSTRAGPPAPAPWPSGQETTVNSSSLRTAMFAIAADEDEVARGIRKSGRQFSIQAGAASGPTPEAHDEVPPRQQQLLRPIGGDGDGHGDAPLWPEDVSSFVEEESEHDY